MNIDILKKTAFLAVSALASMSANAELIYADWLIAGDNKVVLDTNTGIEYLNTGITRTQSINEVLTRISTDLKGWRFAEGYEVRGMITSFFAANGGGEGPMSQFNNLFTDNTYPYTYALYQEDNGIYMAGRNYSTAYLKYDGGYTMDSSAAHMAIWLASDGGLTLSSINDPSLNINNANAPVNQVAASVPLPASLGLLALAMVGFSARRKIE